MAECPYFCGKEIGPGDKPTRFIIHCNDEKQKFTLACFDRRESWEKKLEEQCVGDKYRGFCRPYLFRRLEEMGERPTSEDSTEQLRERYLKKIQSIQEENSMEEITSTANLDLEISQPDPQYQEAYKLHTEIIMSGNLAATAMVQCCKSLKRMRDERLFTALGFTDFDEYVENMVKIKARQAYTYISTYERLGDTVLQSNAGLGITKLALLAAVPAADRDDVLENNDLESMSTRQIKELTEQLREKGEQLSLLTAERDEAKQQLEDAQADAADPEEIEKLKAAAAESAKKAAEAEHLLKATEKQQEERIRQAKADAKKDAEAKLAGKVEKARVDGEKAGAEKVKESLAAIEAEKAAALERAEKLQKELAVAGNKDAVIFATVFDEFQGNFNRLLGLLHKIGAGDPETAGKFAGALKKYTDMLTQRVNEIHFEGGKESND